MRRRRGGGFHVGTDPESVYKLPTRDAAVSSPARLLTLPPPFHPQMPPGGAARCEVTRPPPRFQ